MSSDNQSKSPALVQPIKRRVGANADRPFVDESLLTSLLAAVDRQDKESALIRDIGGVVVEATGVSTQAYLQSSSSKSLRFVYGDSILESLPPEARPKLAKWAAEVLASGKGETFELSGAKQWIITMYPLATRNAPPGVWCAAVEKPGSNYLGASSALAISSIALWYERQHAQRCDSEAENLAALLELGSKLDLADRPSDAYFSLVNELKEFFSAERVVLGLAGANELDCKLAAVSGLSRFDRRAELTRVIESAMNESLIRHKVTSLPASDPIKSEGTLAHAHLLKSVKAGGLISAPLLDQEGKPLGVVMVVLDRDPKESECDALRAAQSVFGSKIESVQRVRGNPLVRVLRRAAKALNGRKVQIAALCTVLLSLAMLIPMKYQIGCACQLEPVSRRFVAAPYDGTLEKSLVRPGDRVTQGQVLARMDARELRWELAGLKADYESERKTRDAAFARDEVALAQQSNLEMKRLKLKMQVIEHRLDNLEIKSPIDGVVIAGDLQKSEGAPFTIGQTVFEIGPLDEMIVEVAIPERDITYAQDGMKVRVVLDSAMREPFDATVLRISPRAEVRDAESVYIADVYLPNEDGKLRPGMKGTARIASEKRSLGWILFHKAWESFAMLIGC